MNDVPFHAAVFGATSAIATEILRAMVATHTCELLLVGRDRAKLEVVAADLRARGAACRCEVADLTDPAIDWHDQLGGRIWDLFLIAHGSHADQEMALADPPTLARTLAENFTSQAALGAVCARILERQKRGTLAVIGAASGDRTDAGDFVHASAKAGLAAFMEGLGKRFSGNRKLHAVLIKPAPTDTPLTAGQPTDRPPARADQVGQAAWEAICQGRKVAYIPGWWRPLISSLKILPAADSRQAKS